MKQIIEIFSTQEYERKLLLKHNVEMYEVEEVIFDDAPKFKHVEKGIKIEGEDKYRVLGQTNSGRYLAVFFHKLDNRALIVSARDMAEKERKQYERK